MRDISSDFARLVAANRKVTVLGGIFYDAKTALLKSAMRAARDSADSSTPGESSVPPAGIRKRA